MTLIASDSDFHDDSFRFQASWDDWGRSNNYKPVKQANLSHAITELGLSLKHPDWEKTLDQFVQPFFDQVGQFKDEPTRANVLIERVRAIRPKMRFPKSLNRARWRGRKRDPIMLVLA